METSKFYAPFNSSIASTGTPFRKKFGSFLKTHNVSSRSGHRSALSRNRIYSLDQSEADGLEIIYKELRNHLLQVQPWKITGIQLSFVFSEQARESLLDKIFRLKIIALQHKIGELVLLRRIPYPLVFDALSRLLNEYSLLDQFSDWVGDPVTMLETCVQRYELWEAN